MVDAYKMSDDFGHKDVGGAVLLGHISTIIFFIERLFLARELACLRLKFNMLALLRRVVVF